MRAIYLLVFILAVPAAVSFSAMQAKSSDPPQTVGQQGQGPPSITPPMPGQNPQEDETRARIEKEMAKKANQERQAQLKRDTDHLLALATELKQYVDKTNENVLSVDVVKKAEEIEKLAHSVKEKMKGGG